jgi:membrane protein YdbS with pleckstrin-like domain
MNTIYCSNCGQLIPGTSNFCRFCGVPLHGPEASAYLAQQETVLPGEKTVPVSPSKPDTIPKSHLNSTVIIIFVLNYIKITSLLFPVLLIGIWFQPLIFGLITVLAIVVLLSVAIWAYNNFTYEVTEDGLLIEFGIIHHKTISVPFDQVQNVNIERSVVDRMLNLARISIETAGSAVTQPIQVIGGYTARSEAYLPGLTLLQAKMLHDILIDGKLDEEY